MLSRLTAQLVDKRTDVRQQAAKDLGKMGAEAKPAIAALAVAAADSNAQLQKAAKLALAEIDPKWRQSPEAESAVPELVQRLGVRTSNAAPEVLAQIGAKAVACLIELLGEKDAEGLRHALAIGTLGQIGVAAELAMTAIAHALRSGPTHVQRAAAIAISRIGRNPVAAVPALNEALGSADSVLRESAARALRAYAQEPVDVSSLVRLLGDREESVRQTAGETLQAFGAAAVPALIATLETREAWRHKEQWKEMVEVLDRALPRDRIGFSDRKEYVLPPTVFYAIEECDWAASQLLQGAVSVLGALGPAAGDAAAVLADLLRDRDKHVRAAAAKALGRIGPQAQIAVPALVGSLSDNHEEAGMAAVESLTKVEPNWPSDPSYAAALELLLARLDQGPTRTKRLEQCLAKTGAGLVAPLAGQLASPSRSIREAVCRVLGGIGPAALPAVEMLQRIAEADENRGVRESASDALRKILR
jgi:HEAT repeat protein